MSDEIEYWDCDEGQERLTHTDQGEAIEAHLDSLWVRDESVEEWLESAGDEITVYGFKRSKVKPGELYEPLEDILERLDEEHCDPEGEGTEATEVMRNAQTAFLEVIAAEYFSWACEEVKEAAVKVNVKEWVKENCPHWLEEKKP